MFDRTAGVAYRGLTEREKTFIRVYTESEFMVSDWNDTEDNRGYGEDIWTDSHFGSMKEEGESYLSSIKILDALVERGIFEQFRNPVDGTLWLTPMGIAVAHIVIQESRLKY